MFSWFFPRKRRRILVQTTKRGNDYSLVLDLDEVVAINVPDTAKSGCIITLKSGNIIYCPKWDRVSRNKNIKFILEGMK